MTVFDPRAVRQWKSGGFQAARRRPAIDSLTLPTASPTLALLAAQCFGQKQVRGFQGIKLRGVLGAAGRPFACVMTRSRGNTRSAGPLQYHARWLVASRPQAPNRVRSRRSSSRASRSLPNAGGCSPTPEYPVILLPVGRRQSNPFMSIRANQMARSCLAIGAPSIDCRPHPDDDEACGTPPSIERPPNCARSAGVSREVVHALSA